MILKDIRHSRSMTTTQVAQHLGITQGFYSQLENGKRSFSEKQIHDLAVLLQVPDTTIRTAAHSVAEDAGVSRHWISNLPVDGIPLKVWLLQNRELNTTKKAEFKKAIIRLIKNSIEKELDKEFISSPQLLQYLFQKAKSMKPQQ